MFESLRFTSLKFKIFSTLTFALIILLMIFANSIISNFSLPSDSLVNGSKHQDQLLTHHTAEIVQRITSSYENPARDSNDVLIQEMGIVQPNYQLALLQTFDVGKRFNSRILEFLERKPCKVQFFMTWIAPIDSFGEREFLGLESLFKANPGSCLIILSGTMDSKTGRKILKPLIDKDLSVHAITPDLDYLFNNTPAKDWLDDIKNRNKDPGGIPLAQNLSNLIRLAVLYKYGGIYLDMDFIVLKDFSGLRNSIGAQSIDMNGNWTRLNNAVLIFDKNHLLLYKFMEEFAFNYDGNRWGHNGPYLVSRVVDRLEKKSEVNFSVLNPMAFYPVDWTRVAGYFTRPNNQAGVRWVEAKIRQLYGLTYAVHLWNRRSGEFKIEEGSIVSRLLYDHCVICNGRRLQKD